MSKEQKVAQKEMFSFIYFIFFLILPFGFKDLPLGNFSYVSYIKEWFIYFRLQP